MGKYDKNFVDAGGILPENKDPSKQYLGEKFITCIPLLTQVKSNEQIRIKALIMGKVSKPELHYRKLGRGLFKTVDLFHEARGVYIGTIPEQKEDFEWFVTAKTNLGDVIFPESANAPISERMYQTIVVKSINNKLNNIKE